MAISTNNDDKLTRAIARIHAGVLAFVFAALFGIVLFMMTAWLLIKGGNRVGPHLRLLGQYLPGYSVTWMGGIVGLVYGAIIGAIAGWSIGMIYNKIAGFRQARRLDR